jgi:hypothetical protein
MKTQNLFVCTYLFTAECVPGASCPSRYCGRSCFRILKTQHVCIYSQLNAYLGLLVHLATVEEVVDRLGLSIYVCTCTYYHIIRIYAHSII